MLYSRTLIHSAVEICVIKYKLINSTLDHQELEQKAPKEVDNGSSFTIPPEDDAFEVLPEKIILYEVLGEGAFGVVRKGWLPDLNREVAVKMLKGQ